MSSKTLSLTIDEVVLNELKQWFIIQGVCGMTGAGGPSDDLARLIYRAMMEGKAEIHIIPKTAKAKVRKKRSGA